MSTIDEADTAPSENSTQGGSGKTFLCVVDESEEFGAALRFACGRARNTDGRVALLYVMPPAEFQHAIIKLGYGNINGTLFLSNGEKNDRTSDRHRLYEAILE